jgi:hypothetical protein
LAREAAVNQELRALFDEDQADRRGELPADLYGTSAAASWSSSC